MSAFLTSSNSNDGMIYTFSLPHNFQLPVNLLCCSSQEFATALHFASQFLEKQNLALNHEIKEKLFEEFSQSSLQKLSIQLKKSQEENLLLQFLQNKFCFPWYGCSASEHSPPLSITYSNALSINPP